MGNGQLGIGIDNIVKEQEIQVQCTGPPALLPNPAKQGFPRLEDPKEVHKFTGCLYLGHTIQEPFLIRLAKGLGLIKGGAGLHEVTSLGHEPPDRLPDGGLPVPLVGANTHRG
jgi:hypothetical protein